MSDTQILIQFKNTLVSFLDELIEAFPSEAELIVLRIYINDQASIENIMNTFLLATNKDDRRIAKDIKARNEIVFVKNEIFESFSKIKSTIFVRLWRSDQFDDEERKIIWEWIDSFVYLAERYAKTKNKTAEHTPVDT